MQQILPATSLSIMTAAWDLLFSPAMPPTLPVGWPLAGRCVLETVAGTGIVTRHLRDLLPASASLLATDLTPPMLDVARIRFRAAESVAFEQADATALPLPDGVFDAVVCQFGVMFFPEKDRSYHEVYRACPRRSLSLQRLGL
jgi:ubiquinone/menaquinone biosynthesis C-methylase UbiE